MAWARVKFFYDTMLGSEGSTLTASSTASGDYSVNYLYNMLEVNSWKAADVNVPIYIHYDNGVGAGHTGEADYIIIFGHNLNTVNAKITLQYSMDDFVSDINDAFTGEKPTSDGIYLREFDNPGPKRYWRLKLEDNNGGGSLTSTPYMTLCIWGRKSEIDYVSTSFDPHGQTIHAKVNITQGGYVSGIHTSYIERKITLNFHDADEDVYAKIEAWRDINGMKQFFVGWETLNRPNDVYLMYPDGQYNNPLSAGGRYRNIAINLKGRKA